MNEEKEVYSYHTFYFPFIWEGIKVKQEEIISYFDSNHYWEKTDIKDFSNVNTTPALQDEKSRIWLYQAYQYFHTPVCQAIFGGDSEVVHNYQFCTKEVRQQACYTIKKTEKFNNEMIKKVECLARLCGPQTEIIADGGIAEKEFLCLKKAGATGAVMGRTIFASEHPCDTIETFSNLYPGTHHSTCPGH